MATFDGAILNASFIPTGDMLTMQFVFSSEEFPEYISSNVNDAFGVWVNGTFVPVSVTVGGNVAIDVAVMEKTDRGAVLPLDAGWSDVGSWSALWETADQDEHGNVLRGRVLHKDARNCYLRSEHRLW